MFVRLKAAPHVFLEGWGAYAVTWAWWTAADDELFICSPVAGEGPGAITQPGICSAILSRSRSEPISDSDQSQGSGRVGSQAISSRTSAVGDVGWEADTMAIGAEIIAD